MIETVNQRRPYCSQHSCHPIECFWTHNACYLHKRVACAECNVDKDKRIIIAKYEEEHEAVFDHYLDSERTRND